MELNEFGKKIREIRFKYGDNQKKLAQKMGISMAFLSAMEVGNKTIPIDFPDRVSAIYNLPLQDLVELRNAVDMANERINISLKNLSDDDIKTSLAFARTVAAGDKAKMDKIRKILGIK